MATAGPAGGAVKIPAFGEYDINSRAIKVAESVLAAGDTLGAAAAASDSNTFVNWFSDTQETIELFNMQSSENVDYICVLDVHSFIITAFTASVTMTVGDSDDVDGFMVAAAIGCTTARTTTVPTVNLTSDYIVEPYARGKIYGDTVQDSDAAIEVVCGGADIAAGRAAFYASYFVVDHAIYG